MCNAIPVKPAAAASINIIHAILLTLPPVLGISFGCSGTETEGSLGLDGLLDREEGPDSDDSPLFIDDDGLLGPDDSLLDDEDGPSDSDGSLLDDEDGLSGSDGSLLGDEDGLSGSDGSLLGDEDGLSDSDGSLETG